MFKKGNVTNELRMAEANYWSSKLNYSRSGSKEFWNVVKLLTGKSAKSKPIGHIMYEQKEIVVEDSTIAAPLTFSFQQLGKNLPNLSHRGRLTLILLLVLPRTEFVLFCSILQFFTIWQENLHSFNIHDEQSTRFLCTTK